MKLSPTQRDHLAGRTFSSGAAFELGPSGRALPRGEHLVQLVQGRRVLHVGCCDHLPLIPQKMAQGLYLHQNLCRSAAHCVGVDISEPGVRLLRELGFGEVYVPDEVPAQDFDICLLADVIEHVGDPVSFLRSMRRYRFSEMVVVTPNAFRWRNLLPGPEVINTDHRFWFSPYTLCKVLVDAGYRPEQLALCHGDIGGWKGALAARVVDWIPRWRDMLVVRASAVDAP